MWKGNVDIEDAMKMPYEFRRMNEYNMELQLRKLIQK